MSRIADLSAGHPIPTGIAPAPDGGAYVGLFTNIPDEDGTAAVVDVAPDGALYVAGPTFGAEAGQGTIVRLDVAARAPIAVPSTSPGGLAC